MTFSVIQSTPVMIYGYSAASVALANDLLAQGYSITCYIDQNAEYICAQTTIPILTLSQANANVSSIVLICLQNILQHEKVATELYQCGVRNVLCLSAGHMLGSEDARTMLYKYRALLSRSFSELHSIPALERQPTCYNPQKYEIQECDDTVTWLLPVELFFTRKLPETDAASSRQRNVSKRCILSCTPYHSLFSHLENGGDVPEDYLDAFAGEDTARRQALLRDRGELYQRFLQELECGLGFFIDSAPDGWLSQGGRYTVADGIHRSYFLVSKGFNRIPLRTSRQDFDRFMDFVSVNAVLETILQENKFFYFEHPACYSLFDRPDRFPVSLLVAAMQLLESNRIELSGATFLEADNHWCYLARNFIRAGVTRAHCYCMDENRVTAQAVNQLFQMDISLCNNTVDVDILYWQADCNMTASVRENNFARFIASASTAIILEAHEDNMHTYADYMKTTEWELSGTRRLLHGTEPVIVALYEKSTRKV